MILVDEFRGVGGGYMNEYQLVPSFCSPYDPDRWLGLVREQLVTDFRLELRTDTELSLLDTFVPLLASGQKATTVRYAKNKIRVPQETVLGLFETKADDKNYKLEIGSVYIPTMTVKSIGDLTQDDGKRDGFSGKEELISIIEGIYGKVGLDELVSIYKIAEFDNFRKH